MTENKDITNETKELSETKKPKKQGLSRRQKIRFIAITGILGAISTVLMMLSFSVPFMPSFLKLDFSELPALVASFSMGPLAGVAVCFIKNLINVTMSTTGGVGELSNFLLGVCLVLPAGLVYKFRKNRLAAFLSALAGSLIMALASLPLNYFVTYPMYMKFMPIEAIIGMYEAILPGVDGLLSCLLIFNIPFTFLKGLLVTVLTFIIYKHISPIIKGVKK
jgi:riboflavin transporter FmnP